MADGGEATIRWSCNRVVGTRRAIARCALRKWAGATGDWILCLMYVGRVLPSA